MMNVTYTREAIHFNKNGRGCSAFYFDLIHHPFSRTRGIRLFFRQIVSGCKLILEKARCPYCNSIWVCWNWMHAWGGDFEKYCEMNPHMSREELKKSQWGHECWDCDNVHETEYKVTNGIPYWFLRRFYKLFHKDFKEAK